jgi:hypothetical protein
MKFLERDENGYLYLLDLDIGPNYRRFTFTVCTKGWNLYWAGLLWWHGRLETKAAL